MFIDKAQYNPIPFSENKASKQISVSKTPQSYSNRVNYPAYYKDFLIDNKKLLSFGSSYDSVSREPETREEFIKGLNSLNKYSQDDIENILSFIQEILDSDDWEETQENILFEMFTSLALSKDNSSMEVLSAVKNGVIELEQDDDYVDVNAYCKGISALCSDMDYKDYRFSNIINHITSIDEENNEKFFELLRDNISGANPDKISKMIDDICRKNAQKGLKEVNSLIEEIKNKYGYKNEDLIDSISMAVNEDIAVEDIPVKLKNRRVAKDVYSALKIDFLPDKNAFETVFAKPIEELTKRGYTPVEIADMISHNNFIFKLMDIENISKANEVILADFIEDIPNMYYNEDIIRQYTKGSSVFNELLSIYKGDISKFPKDKIYETESGVKYTASDAKGTIYELSEVLEKQSLKRDMVVYRGEGFGILSQKTTLDGTPMDEALKKAIKDNDEPAIQNIIAQLNGSTITQHRFMSTSYDKGGAYNFIKGGSGIIWQINAPKGSHAIYCDPFNVDHGVEKEILFNKGCSLKINNAEYKDGKLFLQADLLSE